ncbi:unnamed protein product [Linum trigynum]|uniref:F-box domain-containing protein n=1 Tax=Linum trigynum TaxID=586398 RepID=A0AAV2GD42_9ROSI
MKRVCQASDDRITSLLADVIHHILAFLPIKDAAKASTLSRKWRHHWRSIPRLVFDHGFARNLEEDVVESSSMNNRIMLNICTALLVHDGPITKFELSIPGLCACREIDHIILHLSSNGVQDFTLMFYCRYIGTAGYHMHTSLFSALHLKSLTLRSCAFTPPTWFTGFNMLTNLQLINVILPSDFFKEFLPKCPMLESLRAIECSAPAGRLEIVAPFLKYFTFVGSFLDVCFEYAPLLSHVSLDLAESNTPDMVSLFASLLALQQLLVNYDILKFLAQGDRNFPTRLPTPIEGLKVLETISIVFDGLEMERVFVCLIMSSPNLRSLTVQMESGEPSDLPANDEVSSIRRLLEAEDSPGCLKHLREFRIDDTCGCQAELDLVRFVLATAPILQSIHITAYYKLDTKKVMKLMKEVMHYKRVSKEAELIFNWNDDED